MSGAFDILDYVEGRLDRVKPSALPEYTALCPACENWGSFYVNTDRGRFVCFKCDFRGMSIVGLIAEVEGITWSEAQAYVFKHSVSLRRKDDLFTLGDRVRALRDMERAGEDPPVEYDIPKEFKPCFREGKWSLPAYLKERHIKSATARTWNIGWARAGRYSGRLIIPIVCPGGYSFTARDMTGDQEPKYLNPTGADHRRLLIGWNVFKLKGDFGLVEGPLDSTKMFQHSHEMLGTGGKVLHSDQLRMLFALSPDSAVTVMLDPEEVTAPYDMASQLAVHFHRIFIAHLPDGVDPGKSTRRQANRAVYTSERYTGDRIVPLKGRVASLKSRY